MSAKIVFDGQTYDGLDSMPPDVRTRYQGILDALGADDRAKLEAAMGGGAGIRINATVRRKIRVNGKDYDSVEAMPAGILQAYERAMAGKESVGAGQPPQVAMPSPPPAIDADDSRAGSLVRVALLIVAALIVVVWLLSRR
jgi:hypothetical protein